MLVETRDFWWGGRVGRVAEMAVDYVKSILARLAKREDWPPRLKLVNPQ